MALELYQLISAFMTHVRVVRSICMKGARDAATAGLVNVSVTLNVIPPPVKEPALVIIGVCVDIVNVDIGFPNLLFNWSWTVEVVPSYVTKVVLRSALALSRRVLPRGKGDTPVIV